MRIPLKGISKLPDLGSIELLGTGPDTGAAPGTGIGGSEAGGWGASGTAAGVSGGVAQSTFTPVDGLLRCCRGERLVDNCDHPFCSKIKHSNALCPISLDLFGSMAVPHPSN